jgi:hypothetical protein
MELTFTDGEIAQAIGKYRLYVQRRASKEEWQRCQKGKKRPYLFDSLPDDIQVAILCHYPEEFIYERMGKAYTPEKWEKQSSTKIESLWNHFNSKSNRAREKAAQKLNKLVELQALLDSGMKKKDAFAVAAKATKTSINTLKNWYYGKGGKPGVRDYDRKDWLAVLVGSHAGVSAKSECDAMAWNWLVGHYLNRRAPAFADSYRRLEEVAEAQGWTIPSEMTLRRRIESEITPQTLTYQREGAQALRKMYPSQVRDKTVFAAGEAVTGDGLKFDKLYIDWGDEVINTTTVWFWADIYSGKLLAYRVGKTENTDIFRLSVWDLTAITLPEVAWVDNTRVAANKAMTGRNLHRNRFKSKDTDPTGVMLQLGIQVKFTDPDHTVSNPGVKPIERAFGRGGIHDQVATHPRFMNRGFSKATAIPVEEFKAILAEEVIRFNSRPGRRTAVCNGHSFDQAFEQSFKKVPVRKASEQQRRLLLLLPEVVTAHRETGEVSIQAGRGPHGRHRYWNEELSKYKRRKVVAYYDPENLQNDAHIYTLDGQWICDAQWLASVAFNDTVTAREWNKNKRRKLKAQRQVAKAEKRMNAIELAGLYPSPDSPEMPSPSLMQPVFGGTGRKEIDGVSKAQTKRIDDADFMGLDNSRYQKMLAGVDDLMIQAAQDQLKDELDWEAPRKAASDIE